MDDDQSGRDDLTAEQSQRCDWAREMWKEPVISVVWPTVEDCVDSLIDQGLYDSGEIIQMFKAPEKHPAVLDALFEEWAGRKLLGEIT